MNRKIQIYRLYYLCYMKARESSQHEYLREPLLQILHELKLQKLMLSQKDVQWAQDFLHGKYDY